MSNANLPHSKEHSCKSIRGDPHPGKPDERHNTDGFKKLSCSLSHINQKIKLVFMYKVSKN